MLINSKQERFLPVRRWQADTRSVNKGLEIRLICQAKTLLEQGWKEFLTDSSTFTPALNTQASQNTTSIARCAHHRARWGPVRGHPEQGLSYSTLQPPSYESQSIRILSSLSLPA